MSARVAIGLLVPLMRAAEENAKASNVIRRARALIGDTQPQFAKRIGRTPLTVARWENGTRTPSDQDQSRAARVAEAEFARQVGRTWRRKKLPNATFAEYRAGLLSSLLVRRGVPSWIVDDWAAALMIDHAALLTLAPDRGTIDGFDIALLLERAARGGAEVGAVGDKHLVAAALSDRFWDEIRRQAALLVDGVTFASIPA